MTALDSLRPKSEIDQLIKDNVRLVGHFAREFKSETRTKTPMSDLIGEGLIGLAKAAERFNPARGRFSTIAYYWIRKYFYRAIGTKSVSPVTSLNKKVGEDQNELGDFVRDPTELDANGREARNEAVSSLNCLDSRSREIMRLRAGLLGGAPMTQKAIGKKIGLSERQVRRLEKSALKKIKEIAGVDVR